MCHCPSPGLSITTGEIKRNLDQEEQQQPSIPCFLPSAEKGERNKQIQAYLVTELQNYCASKQNLLQSSTDQQHPVQSMDVLIYGFRTIF